MVEVFCLDVSFLDDDGVFRRLYARMSGVRQKKTDALRFRKDKNLSLGAGLLLDHRLGAENLCERERTYAFSPYGKPYFADLPSFRFNLSHSGTCVMVSFSGHETGCDVEQITECHDAVAKRFFRESEYGLVTAQPTKQARDDVFFRLWTLKESYMKYTGLGMRLTPDSFAVFPGNPVTVVPEPDIPCYFKEFDTVPGYRCAVCSGEPCDDVPLVRLDAASFL